jgi:tRNA(Ile)-lysidine synthase
MKFPDPFMHDLENKFVAHCRDLSYFHPGDAVLLAVSGGLDSMVMLHLFHSAKIMLDITIGIIHINHGLRGAESNQDEEFVTSLSRQLGVPCFIERTDIRALARINKQSVEEAARRFRYDTFERCAGDNHYTFVCTAHHGDDQAETILARIIQGTGWSGLTGIREHRGRLIRPLLTFSRADLVLYAECHQIPFRQDSTNTDISIFRNRIRHRLLPEITQNYDPQTVKHLIHLSQIANETETWIQNEIQKSWPEVCCYQDPDKIKLDIERFNHYLFFQRKMLIKRAFTEILEKNTEPLSLHFHDYSAILSLAEHSESGSVIKSGTITVRKTQTHLIFCNTRVQRPDAFCFEIKKPGNYEWPEFKVGFSLKEVPHTELNNLRLGVSRNVEYIDRSKVKGQLILRNWKSGDRFQPLGMSAFKKLSDFFTDMKIDLWNKSCVPLLIDSGYGREDIIWICGWRLDNRYKIEQSTKAVYKIECYYNES